MIQLLLELGGNRSIQRGISNCLQWQCKIIYFLIVVRMALVGMPFWMPLFCATGTIIDFVGACVHLRRDWL